MGKTTISRFFKIDGEYIKPLSQPINKCPFCGNYPSVSRFSVYNEQLDEIRKGFKVKCDRCVGVVNYLSVPFATLDEAVDEWNNTPAVLTVKDLEDCE